MTESNITEQNIHTPSTPVRSGQWTKEEMSYASELIDLFRSGSYAIGAKKGQTVRSFLAKKLYCNPMRISKKFASEDGLLATKFQHTINRNASFMEPNTKLQHLEHIFLVKDTIVQSNRLKRRKYYHTNLIKSKF
mmetsp:Transcript_26162/g.26398  ORF Transcript_26162/g.26398 Transcript_26162/m.26398 type:complete len:135 (-) Transcript_26162:91-495(-)